MKPWDISIKNYIDYCYRNKYSYFSLNSFKCFRTWTTVERKRQERLDAMNNSVKNILDTCSFDCHPDFRK